MNPDPFAGVRKMRHDRRVTVLAQFTRSFGWTVALLVFVWAVTRR